MRKETKKRLQASAILFILLIGLLKLISTSYSLPFYTYENFGLQIPAGYNTLGIDVSHYQKVINWKQVSEMEDLGMRVKFAFMKATEGTHLIDDQFHRNWKEAKDHKLSRGAYLFFDPRKSGESQAQHFIKQVALESGDFAPVIDFEDLRGTAKSTARQRFLECANRLEVHYGIKPILYTYADFYKQHLNEQFEDFPLWIAHYKDGGTPRIERDWDFWQFSDKGRTDGIGGPVDFNVFNGSSLSFDALKID